MKTFYVTTPIYYVNDKPHIGHAYTSIACDTIARFKRLDGYDVKFLTGTDEHGQKIERAAAAADVDPQTFVNTVSQNFRYLSKLLNFSNDDFIQTTQPRHEKVVIEIWNKLLANGQIYLGKYAGWYAVSDEEYVAEKDIKEAKDGRKFAPSGSVVEWMEEDSYFFRLGDYQQKLLDFYDANPDFIAPKSRRNEVISLVRRGLQDISISRTSFDWGIDVPGDPDHIMYVWLDALTNYISGIDYPNAEFSKFWPESLHIIGKDILKFHAIYWPAFLMGAELDPPKRLFAHGWWTNNGEKISKSRGNVIDPIDEVEKFGVDPIRYFLLREVTFGRDGDYSHRAVQRRNNDDLANDLGNLIQRTLSLVVKFRGGVIPDGISQRSDLLEIVREKMDKQDFSGALGEVFSVISGMNKYIAEEEPWVGLKKLDDVEQQCAGEVLFQVLDNVRRCALILQAFIPETAEDILDFIGVEDKTFASWDVPVSATVGKPTGFFPRVDV